jgi:hypothetical protein
MTRRATRNPQALLSRFGLPLRLDDAARVSALLKSDPPRSSRNAPPWKEVSVHSATFPPWSKVP